MSFRTPLEIGLGGYLRGFYDSLVADTPAMREFVARGLAKSIVWVPGRMIDSVEDMLKEWRKNANEDGPGLSPLLPVMMVAMSKDFTPAMPDFALPVGTPLDITIPDDPEQRNYKARLSVNEYRTQIAIIAPEQATGHSLAMQFHLWANGPGGRRFSHVHEFAGMKHTFPAVLENIDMGGINSPTEQKNLTILVVDMNVRASIPLFQAPKASEPNDGKPAPAGYPVVVEVTSHDEVVDVTGKAHLDAEGNRVVEFQ